MTNTSATIVFTKAGQHVTYFETIADGEIQRYADQHDLCIEQITTGARGQYNMAYAIVVFTKRATLTCAECGGPSVNDYLCETCRGINPPNKVTPWMRP